MLNGVFFVKDSEEDIWDEFLLENNGYWQQGWNWGEALKSAGYKIYRIKIVDNDELIGAAAFIEDKRLGGKYLESIGGPVITRDLTQEEIGQIKEILLLQDKKINFIRFSPAKKNDCFSELKRIKTSLPPENLIFVKRPVSEAINFLEKELRYRIRLAKRYSLFRLLNPGDLDWALVKDSNNHWGIRVFEKDFYAKLFEMGGIEFPAIVWKNKILAVAGILYWGQSATVLFLGGYPKFQNHLYPLHSLLFEIMDKARIKGLTSLNLNYYHPFFRNSLKKLDQFTGRKHNAFDLIINSRRYLIQKIFKRI